MIRPSKHMDLNLSVVNIASHVIAALLANGAMKYDEVARKLQADLGDTVRFEIVLALDFLYLVGVLEYDEGLDALHLLKIPGRDQP